MFKQNCFVQNYQELGMEVAYAWSLSFPLGGVGSMHAVKNQLSSSARRTTMRPTLCTGVDKDTKYDYCDICAIFREFYVFFLCEGFCKNGSTMLQKSNKVLGVWAQLLFLEISHHRHTVRPTAGSTLRAFRRQSAALASCELPTSQIVLRSSPYIDPF